MTLIKSPLKILLIFGSLYYLVGGIVHLFGFDVFPWYTRALYSSYHDTVIALSAFTLAVILFVVARNPVKNIEVLNALIICGLLAILFSFYIIWQVNFAPAAEAKRFQTLVELVLLVVYLACLILLKPKVKS